ncbi:MAG: hypothetical protein AAF573_05660 [Bacteroidota bacterium]
MKEVEKIANDSLYLEMREILRIANKAAKRAKEENKKYGIPRIYWRNGRLYYELSNGIITEEQPEILKKKTVYDK